MTLFLDQAPITRSITIVAFVMMVLTYFNVVDQIDLFFDKDVIFRNNEWYRFFTSLFYFGGMKLSTLSNIFGFVNFASKVESSIFSNRPAEYLMFIAFAAVMNWISSIMFTGEMFFGAALASVCFYYWSKHYADQSMQVMGIPFFIKSGYVPFIYVALAYTRGGFQAMIPDLMGIIIGHIYYYCHDVMAIRFNTKLLKAPECLTNLCKKISL
jgi:Derlin-2/3